MATTYYHVAGASYQSGDALLPYNTLVEHGVEVAWKWEDAPEGFDGDVVCVFTDRADAEDFLDEFGGSAILTITAPDDEPADGQGVYPTNGYGYVSPRLTTVEEGFTAFASGIPAAWISEA